MEEYQDYQLAPSSELPTFKSQKTRLNAYWFDMANQTVPIGKHAFHQKIKSLEEDVDRKASSLNEKQKDKQ